MSPIVTFFPPKATYWKVHKFYRLFYNNVFKTVYFICLWFILRCFQYLRLYSAEGKDDYRTMYWKEFRRSWLWPNRGYKSAALLLHRPAPFETDEGRDLRTVSYNAIVPVDFTENICFLQILQEKYTNTGTHIQHVSLWNAVFPCWEYPEIKINVGDFSRIEFREAIWT